MFQFMLIFGGVELCWFFCCLILFVFVLMIFLDAPLRISRFLDISKPLWRLNNLQGRERWNLKFFFRCSLIQEWSQANKWWFQNICRGFTLPNNSHHQDFYSTFLVGDHCKPWFATVIGKGLIFVEDPWLVCLVETTIRSSLQKDSGDTGGHQSLPVI